jgi:hypothetical protein
MDTNIYDQTDKVNLINRIVNDDELYVKLLNSGKYDNIFQELNNNINDSFKSNKKYNIIKNKSNRIKIIR